MLSQDVTNLYSVFVLTIPTFDFFKILLIENQTILDLLALHNEVAQLDSPHPKFKVLNGILYHKGSLS